MMDTPWHELGGAIIIPPLPAQPQLTVGGVLKPEGLIVLLLFETAARGDCPPAGQSPLARL
jgi:hypothetical protein